MSQSPFHDDRALGLLARVGDDISHLKQDLRTLLSHTSRHTVPHGARELADSARQHFASGSARVASSLRSLKSAPPKEAAVGVAGGLLVVGLLAFGVYALLKCKSCEEVDAGNDVPEI